MTRILPILTVSCLATVLILISFTNAYAGDDEFRLRAQLSATSGDISGQADYRDKRGRTRFSVEAEGLVPGDVFDVMVAGVPIGTLIVNDLGIAEINLDSNFEAGDDPATQMPANFPAIDGGELVQVGPLSGTLQIK